MNVNLQKYAPPCSVLAIALYLGWPPEAPLDLGEDVVRAKSVRWKVTDLETPSLPAVVGKDPFAAVLVQQPSDDPSRPDAATDSTPEAPVGPTDEDLRNGLRLAGIAQTDDHRWAILNGSVCKLGDQVPVDGLVDVTATIREIASDHITVVSGPLTIRIKRQERPKRTADSAASTANPAPPTAGNAIAKSQDEDEQADDEDEEPSDDEQAPADPEPTDSDRQRGQADPPANFFPVNL
ncbi:hypothetical protein Enr13x_27130 [Stieleria neptunia]|uniref:Uncharacterized protein n=1 Tax=Stieleria neptunia TaxID=2527979 RepID=A0A518HPU5_9BACT|nr:hypothetical protein [Stieleria neptunia]QDV42862.1 hypothetical protein Enr13x_27130 [Stieleria neptunia]